MKYIIGNEINHEPNRRKDFSFKTELITALLFTFALLLLFVGLAIAQ